MKSKPMLTSNSNEWYTPKELYDEIEQRLQIKFTLDPCATKESAKCDLYYTKKEDGLSKDWGGHNVFINPPYSRDLQPKFIRKAYEESLKTKTVCVLLIPARTDTKIWHEVIFPYSRMIYFVKGRIKFQTMQNGQLTYKDASTFPSAIIVFNGDNQFYDKYKTLDYR